MKFCKLLKYDLKKWNFKEMVSVYRNNIGRVYFYCRFLSKISVAWGISGRKIDMCKHFILLLSGERTFFSGLGKPICVSDSMDIDFYNNIIWYH